MVLLKFVIVGRYCSLVYRLQRNSVFYLLDFTRQVSITIMTVFLRDRSFRVMGDGKFRCSQDTFERKDIISCEECVFCPYTHRHFVCVPLLCTITICFGKIRTNILRQIQFMFAALWFSSPTKPEEDLAHLVLYNLEEML